MPPGCIVEDNINRKPDSCSLLDRKCPKNHPLHKVTPSNRDRSKYVCDYCGKSIPIGCCRIECRTCDFDVCRVCYFKIQSGDELKSFYEKTTTIPSRFICPITGKMMHVPVMNLKSGMIYERLAIRLWIKSGRKYDPNKTFSACVSESSLQYQSNLRDEIRAFIKKTKTKFKKPTQTSRNWDEIFDELDAAILKNVTDDSSIKAQMKKKAMLLLGSQESVDAENEVKEQKMNDKAMLLLGYQEFVDAENEVKEQKMNDNEDGSLILNKNIMFRLDMPIVTIMGPARHGKSTLINDLLEVPDACQTSRKANKSCTKGAWITICCRKKENKNNGNGMIVDTIENKDGDMEEKKSVDIPDAVNQFYLIDMEGCATECTNLTRKLFYICYAISNVIIWNDKDIGNDNFKQFMNSFKDEMKMVKESKRKPTFLYLERDAGSFDYEPVDSLDEYIKSDDSFRWLRELHIFSSVNGYELDRRPGKTRKPFLKQDMDDLYEQLMGLIQGSTAFVSNQMELMSQIETINKNTTLSLGLKRINEDPILRLLYHENSNVLTKRHKMTLAAVKWKWNETKIYKAYQKSKSRIILPLIELKLIDDALVRSLDLDVRELCERVKNKIDNIVEIQNENELVTWMPKTNPGNSVWGKVRYGLGGFIVSLLASDEKERNAVYDAAKIQWDIKDDMELRYELGPTDWERRF